MKKYGSSCSSRFIVRKEVFMDALANNIPLTGLEVYDTGEVFPMDFEWTIVKVERLELNNMFSVTLSGDSNIIVIGVIFI